jgi:hypothetical protein
MNDDKTISRAGMIQKLALAPIAIGALAALRAEADAAPTMTQAAAGYVSKSPNKNKCSACTFFIPGKKMGSAGTCKLVKGTIQPGGWCKFFSAKH